MLHGVHLKLRFIICLLERVIFSYMDQNIWQNFRMFGTFWYIHAQERKKSTMRKMYSHSCIESTKAKIKKIQGKGFERLGPISFLFSFLVLSSNGLICNTFWCLKLKLFFFQFFKRFLRCIIFIFNFLTQCKNVLTLF